MKLLKKVKTIEVKRCFVLSQRFTSKNIRRQILKKEIIRPIKGKFKNDLKSAKSSVSMLSENKLDCIISIEDKKRLAAYNNVQWYIGYVDSSEVGLWRGAGKISEGWTRGSLKETAKIFAKELKKERSRCSRTRAMKVIPEIIQSKAIIQKERYLLPIVLPREVRPDSRKGMRKFDLFIDDGCMRSLAFAITGDHTIKAYIGKKIR